MNVDKNAAFTKMFDEEALTQMGAIKPKNVPKPQPVVKQEVGPSEDVKVQNVNIDEQQIRRMKIYLLLLLPPR